MSFVFKGFRNEKIFQLCSQNTRRDSRSAPRGDIIFSVQANLRETKTRKEAAPSTGKFVQAGDVEFFIQEMGPQDGQPIIFIHGTAAWSGLWRETMSPLAEAGYRCIAIDIPPFGYSERPASPSYGNADQAKRIIAMMDELNIERAILFGHSFGGGATMETALMIPDRIDALILLDVGGLNLNLQPAPENQKPSAIELFLGTPAIRNPVLAATGTNPLFTKTLISAMVLDPDDVTQEKIQILQEPLVLEGATNTLGDWLKSVLGVQKASLTTDPANYAVFDMPALILWGDSDSIIPLKEGEYLHSLLSNSELVVMKDVNHIPHLEDIDKVIELVLGFLESPR
ncbi:MAG: alpha/beta hydrolase [Anaerolineae bacterium]|nr:alpha/beta hydrolase [Anaerolineae bacterium]MCI0609526.1 alpha/beta hydrolase [Anaerolineae bacterium]